MIEKQIVVHELSRSIKVLLWAFVLMLGANALPTGSLVPMANAEFGVYSLSEVERHLRSIDDKLGEKHVLYGGIEVTCRNCN